ncbi:MAG: hypothetical protein AB7P99_06350 [Vicinamibacterales bacterium]
MALAAYLEASDPSTPAGRAQRAAGAGRQVVGSYHDVERQTVEQYLRRLNRLRDSLSARLLDGAVTDFRAASLRQLVDDTDRLIADAQADLQAIGGDAVGRAFDLGQTHVDDTIAAAHLLQRRLGGLDRSLVQVTFDQLADLLTPAMQQFRTDVVTKLRGVALAGDSKMAAILSLRDTLADKGIANAQYSAERIIRTELGRTFNGATFDRLLALAADFPFLRKGWKATNDARTRDSHRAAALAYARGIGIPVGDRFTLKPTKGPAVTLRYPVDPLAQPAGRPAARETILCRCHAFVDFSIAEFAAYAKQRVSIAVQGLKLPTPVPFPAPTPTPAPSGAKATPRAPTLPTPRVTRVEPEVVGPLGTPIGPAVDLRIDSAAHRAMLREVLDEIDGVHGDGPLAQIPLYLDREAPATTNAYYVPQGIGYPPRLAMTAAGMRRTPRLTLVHEVGHWLDEQALGDPTRRPANVRMDILRDEDAQFFGTRNGNPAFNDWIEAVHGSQAFRQIFLIEDADPFFVRYLTSRHELWARSYAQYIATRSGNALLLADLNRVRSSAIYPQQWTDADFEPIGRAMDRMFADLGWRGPKRGDK